MTIDSKKRVRLWNLDRIDPNKFDYNCNGNLLPDQHDKCQCLITIKDSLSCLLFAPDNPDPNYSYNYNHNHNFNNNNNNNNIHHDHHHYPNGDDEKIDESDLSQDSLSDDSLSDDSDIDEGRIQKRKKKNNNKMQSKRKKRRTTSSSKPGMLLNGHNVDHLKKVSGGIDNEKDNNYNNNSKNKHEDIDNVNGNNNYNDTNNKVKQSSNKIDCIYIYGFRNVPEIRVLGYKITIDYTNINREQKENVNVKCDDDENKNDNDKHEISFMDKENENKNENENCQDRHSKNCDYTNRPKWSCTTILKEKLATKCKIISIKWRWLNKPARLNQIISCHNDCTFRIYDISSKTVLRTISTFCYYGLRSFDIDKRDGRYIVVGCQNGWILIYDLKAKKKDKKMVKRLRIEHEGRVQLKPMIHAVFAPPNGESVIGISRNTIFKFDKTEWVQRNNNPMSCFYDNDAPFDKTTKADPTFVDF